MDPTAHRPDSEDEDERLLDEAFPLGDGVADLAAESWCPHCGEPVEVMLDPGSGPQQAYVEDCPVCCRPWQVEVRYAADGSAEVRLEVEGE
jgi:hypothetical protein